MTKTAGSTTIEVPLPVKARLAKLRRHARQPYHELITQALDILEAKQAGALDPLVAKHRAALRLAARKNGIARLWLLGRHEHPVAALDFLVHAPSSTSLLALASFLADAEEILGTNVILSDLDAMRPARRDAILPGAVPL
ncbi:MAG TPA: hypothetical protein VM286_03750 [Candidatus Thermoplasmatota archaeon]|nr:hypothetical protein [Candidatus Thermoplasmatota archaeon]